jgi:hypothetical protein
VAGRRHRFSLAPLKRLSKVTRVVEHLCRSRRMRGRRRRSVAKPRQAAPRLSRNCAHNARLEESKRRFAKAHSPFYRLSRRRQKSWKRFDQPGHFQGHPHMCNTAHRHGGIGHGGIGRAGDRALRPSRGRPREPRRCPGRRRSTRRSRLTPALRPRRPPRPSRRATLASRIDPDEGDLYLDTPSNPGPWA